MNGTGNIRIHTPPRFSNSSHSIKDNKAQLSSAKDLIACRQYQKGLSIIERLVNNNYAPAQLLLGDMYFHGRDGVAKDQNIAIDLYKKAAAGGSLIACRILVSIYANDRNLDENYELSWHWCKEGLKLGLVEAGNDEETISAFARIHNRIGVMYYHGLGTEKDLLQALVHFKIAADHGDASALGNLGWFSQLDLDQNLDHYKARAAPECLIVKDHAEALAYYRTSVEHGNVKRLKNIESIYQFGHNVEKGHAETLQWNKDKQAARFARECTATGDMYRLGNGVEINFAQAKAWYQKAIEHNEPSAIVKLANLTNYEQKQLQEAEKCKEVNNFEAAYAIWLPLAEKGSARAQFWVGQMYAMGLGGVKQDFTEAVIWYKKAAEAGDTWACCNLGYAYRKGEGVPQDDKEAVTWFKKAAIKGEAVPCYNVAYMCQHGYGIKKDMKTAFSLHKKAADVEKKADGCGGRSSYEIATTFKHEIKASEIPVYLKQAHELGHPEAAKAIFALSVEYEKKYEDDKNEDDRIQAEDLLNFAVEANYLDAVVKMEKKLQLKMERQLREQMELEKQTQKKGIEPDNQPSFNMNTGLNFLKNKFSSNTTSSSSTGKGEHDQLYGL
jgi:TPR repeat protein